MIHSHIQSVTAFAPATSANVAVGFDILGFALDHIGDTVKLSRRADKKIVINSIQANENLPFEIDKNTASWVLEKFCQDLKLDFGFSIDIKKGIPLCSGMGGSAASAVAALVAANQFLTDPLSLDELANYALKGEELASGQAHADNIVPCLWGGVTLIHLTTPFQVISLPTPPLYCVLVHPHLHVATKTARKILKPEIPLKDYIQQSSHLAATISALYRQDLNLLKVSLIDMLIEPQRSQFIPGFYNIKQAALDTGAIAMSLSGSGPSLFAFAENEKLATRISEVIQNELMKEKVESDCWVSKINPNGAAVIEIK